MLKRTFIFITLIFTVAIIYQLIAPDPFLSRCDRETTEQMRRSCRRLVSLGISAGY